MKSRICNSVCASVNLPLGQPPASCVLTLPVKPGGVISRRNPHPSAEALTGVPVDDRLLMLLDSITTHPLNAIDAATPIIPIPRINPFISHQPPITPSRKLDFAEIAKGS